MINVIGHAKHSIDALKLLFLGVRLLFCLRIDSSEFVVEGIANIGL